MKELSQEIIKGIDSSPVYDLAIKTPLEKAKALSFRLKNEILFKREDLQPVFSFKLRGAYQKMKSLSPSERLKGVIAVSAGNHAQGVALGARELGIRATIVMPVTTPEIKVNAVRAYGAQTILHGDSYDDALVHCRDIMKEEDQVFIHPYDDPQVIAGQGTIAKEIIDQAGPEVDAVFVAVGGGGLLAGILTYLKEKLPRTKVIAVESEDSACLQAALEEGERVTLESVGIFADGVAVKQIGELPFELVKDRIDQVITVTTDQICSAIRDVYEENRTIQEPAGALGVAGLKKYLESNQQTGKRFVTVNCGANMNFDRLQHIAERTEIGDRREVLLSVQIPEKPGSFRKFCEQIGHLTVTEFNYRFAGSSHAQLFVGIGLSADGTSRKELIGQLEKDGYLIDDLSDNDLAKIHLRHMVGGRTPGKMENERLFRFQFPERPRALLEFLQRMDPTWNISLFHYRNHGSAYGRVLVGMQVPKEDKEEFEGFLRNLGYRSFEETGNVAYSRFL